MRKQGFISQKIGDKAGKMPILGWIKNWKTKISTNLIILLDKNVLKYA